MGRMTVVGWLAAPLVSISLGLGADECCLDPSINPRPPIPAWEDQNANPHNVSFYCQFGVTWEKSEYLLGILAKSNADPNNFQFKVCWDLDKNGEKRAFPWLQSTSYDWQWDLSWMGSVVIKPMKLTTYWLDGYAQVIPDALDYYARMGEIAGRKIIPKFMVYGWSKGAIANWPLGRWRSDIVQAVVSVHGCSGEKTYDDSHDVKAKSEGVSPYLFFSSTNDPILHCSSKDSSRQAKNQKKNQPLTFSYDTPCGHHPESCWPLCDYNHIYVTPFWSFVQLAYQYQSCVQWTDKATCESVLCVWDTDLSICAESHPTRFTPSCKKFCGLDMVSSCSGLQEELCGQSYLLVPEEESQAKGMHSRCEFVDGQCASSTAQTQCFFQDECPVADRLEFKTVYA